MQSSFCCEKKAKYILTVCSQRLYLLKLLRAKGLQVAQLAHVCLVISRLVYALPAWGGFLSTELINRINGFLRRLDKYGFTTTLLNFQQLHRNANATLFKKIFNSDHCICLHHLLPPVKSLPMQLRPNCHNCELPLCKYTTFKRSFITRRLFTDNDQVHFYCFYMFYILVFTVIRSILLYFCHCNCIHVCLSCGN